MAGEQYLAGPTSQYPPAPHSDATRRSEGGRRGDQGRSDHRLRCLRGEDADDGGDGDGWRSVDRRRDRDGAGRSDAQWSDHRESFEGTGRVFTLVPS